jgi:hypothetical protein
VVELERTPLAINVELEPPLPTSMVAPTVLRKGLPRMSGGFSLSPHPEYHKVDGDEVVSDLHRHIFGDALGVANGVVTQLQAHARRLQW